MTIVNLEHDPEAHSAQMKITPSAPRHAFELSVSIGGNDWQYVLRTMQELTDHLERHGQECSLSSGGWDGCHSVSIQRREVTPDQYRQELLDWMEATNTQ